MYLFWLELRAAAQRRIRNLFVPLFEGLMAGGLLLMIERALPPSAASGKATAQVMFTASVMALPALQGLHRLISEETASGTLQTLLAVPSGPIKALMSRDLASVFSIALTLPSMLAIISLFSETDAAALIEHAVPIIIMRTGLLGIGMVLGSATMLVKRTGAIVNLMSIIMVVTSLGAGYGKGLPATLAGLSPQGYLALCIYKGVDPLKIMLRLSALSMGWFAIGLVSYNFAVRRARRFGLFMNL